MTCLGYTARFVLSRLSDKKRRFAYVYEFFRVNSVELCLVSRTLCNILQFLPIVKGYPQLLLLGRNRQEIDDSMPQWTWVRPARSGTGLNTPKGRSLMDKQPVHVGAPVQGAPYSPGIITGNLVFVSGQVPMDPEKKEVLRDDFEGEVRLCIANVERVLKAAGTDLEHCVKVVVFLRDMAHFARLNAVYTEYFGATKPARSCIQVARLPLDVDVEIEAIAVLPSAP
jgi:2-iminobutanoate/2-iminopropanoate deaminase